MKGKYDTDSFAESSYMNKMSVLARNLKWIGQKLKRRKEFESGIWVLGEWYGKRCCDNCLYFANVLAGMDDAPQLVWIAKPEADLSLLDSRVRRVEMDTPEAYEILAKADVVIVNQGIVDITEDQDYIVSAPLFVNLWHGVPWKRIGIDVIPDHQVLKKLYARYLTKVRDADLYLVTSDCFADIMKRASCVSDAGLIRAGYPRNELFYDQAETEACRKEVLARLPELSADERNLKIITYLPTFRDKVDDVFSFTKFGDIDELNRFLEDENAVIIQKPHFAARQAYINNTDCSRIVNLDEISTQRLMAASDMLVTDYSSCFFDFLMLDRPVVHYIYDYEYYAHRDRGLYYEIDDVACGDTPRTEMELLTALQENLLEPDKNAKLRAKRREQFLACENPENSMRIYEQITHYMKK